MSTSLIEKAFFLKRVRLFADLSLELLLAIAEKLYEDDYDPQEKVFEAGQVANRIYLVFEGSVEIVDSWGKPLQELGAFDFFGDESLFNEQPRAYSARCLKKSLFYTLSRSHLLSILSECPTVALALLQGYAQELPCRFAAREKR